MEILLAIIPVRVLYMVVIIIIIIIITIIIYCNRVCSDIHTTPINYPCVKDVKVLHVKPGATQSNDYLYSYIEFSQLFMDERLVSPHIQN